MRGNSFCKNGGNPKGDVKITLPNLLLIPALSIICAIVKLCGGVDWNWISVLIVTPMAIYIGWSIGFALVVLLSVMIVRKVRK